MIRRKFNNDFFFFFRCMLALCMCKKYELLPKKNEACRPSMTQNGVVYNLRVDDVTTSILKVCSIHVYIYSYILLVTQYKHIT